MAGFPPQQEILLPHVVETRPCGPFSCTDIWHNRAKWQDLHSVVRLQTWLFTYRTPQYFLASVCNFTMLNTFSTTSRAQYFRYDLSIQSYVSQSHCMIYTIGTVFYVRYILRQKLHIWSTDIMVIRHVLCRYSSWFEHRTMSIQYMPQPDKFKACFVLKKN